MIDSRQLSQVSVDSFNDADQVRHYAKSPVSNFVKLCPFLFISAANNNRNEENVATRNSHESVIGIGKLLGMRA